MSIRRFIPYLIVVGILALLSVFYFSYREYQSYVEVQELVSNAVAFRQPLDKGTQGGGDSSNWQDTQKGNHPASGTSGFATSQMEHASTHRGEFSKKAVKVQMLSPEVVAKYTGGNPHEAIIVSKGAPPPVEVGQTWTADDMVTQFIELPDGKIVKALVVPGQEIREGDRVSAEYIESVRDKQSEINIDGVLFEAPSGADLDLYRQKAVWARMLDTSVEEVDSLIANQELIVKLAGEPLTAEETKINFDFLRKFPKFESLLRSERPDLYDDPPVHDHTHQFPSDSLVFEPDEVDVSSSQSMLSESERGERQPPVPSETPPVSSQEASDQERVSLARFDKAQQLIDQYGREEGLRRFREMDPEAARQYESDPSRLEQDRNESPARQPRGTQ